MIGSVNYRISFYDTCIYPLREICLIGWGEGVGGSLEKRVVVLE